MKWNDINQKLPPLLCRVLVLRKLSKGNGNLILTSDIGVLYGYEASSQWHLLSQSYNAKPVMPTLRSGLVTHWCAIPAYPEGINNNILL